MAKEKSVVVDVFGGQLQLSVWSVDNQLMMLDVNDGRDRARVPLTLTDAKLLRSALLNMTAAVRGVTVKPRKKRRHDERSHRRQAGDS